MKNLVLCIGGRSMRFHTWLTGMRRLRRGLCHSRDRWSSAHAVEGRPPHVSHEYQAGTGIENRR